MKILKMLTILFLWSISFHVFAEQQDPKIKELDGRVKMLEDYKSNIQVTFDGKAENLKKYVDDEIKRELVKVEDAKDTLDLLLWVGLPTTLGAFVLGWLGFLWYARKLVTDRVADIVEKKREDIIRMVETETFDNKLRNTKELLVISASEESHQTMMAFMKKLKFKKVKGRIVGNFDDLPEHDLMIFNTPDDSIEQETIDELIEKYDDEDVFFVAYTGKNLARNPRLNFSNSSFTLYHNILSTLKYSEIARLVEED